MLDDFALCCHQDFRKVLPNGILKLVSLPKQTTWIPKTCFWKPCLSGYVNEADKVVKDDRSDRWTCTVLLQQEQNRLLSVDRKPGLYGDTDLMPYAIGLSLQNAVLRLLLQNTLFLNFQLHQWTVGFPETRLVAVVSSILARKVFSCI